MDPTLNRTIIGLKDESQIGYQHYLQGLNRTIIGFKEGRCYLVIQNCQKFESYYYRIERCIWFDASVLHHHV